MSVCVNLTGQRFGKLVVISRADNSQGKATCWLCKCDCGKEKIIQCNHLKSGHTKSCGCLKLRHGHNQRGKITRTYRSWKHMIHRCTNPNNKSYKNYGSRGIAVCKRWMKFENFLDDMGVHPGSGHSIDRVNNSKGYYKKNCHWATSKQQNRNSRNNHLIMFNGKTRCIAEWAEKFGIPYTTLWMRIYKLDWSIEKALTTPVIKRKIKGTKNV